MSNLYNGQNKWNYHRVRACIFFQCFFHEFIQLLLRFPIISCECCSQTPNGKPLSSFIPSWNDFEPFIFNCRKIQNIFFSLPTARWPEILLVCAHRGFFLFIGIDEIESLVLRDLVWHSGSYKIDPSKGLGTRGSGNEFFLFLYSLGLVSKIPSFNASVRLVCRPAVFNSS